MDKFSKILMGVWAVLAIVAFICAFFCPIFPKIIGLMFGGLNILIILSLVITYFQGIYWRNKLKKDGLQLQESENTATT